MENNKGIGNPTVRNAPGDNNNTHTRNHSSYDQQDQQGPLSKRSLKIIWFLVWLFLVFLFGIALFKAEKASPKHGVIYWHKEKRNTNNMKKMIEKENKEYWTATEVRYEKGEIVWFGNLRGQLFETREAAWNACLDAYESMRRLHSSDIGFGMSTDPDLKRIDIWIGRDKSWAWEVQAVCVGGYAGGNEYKRL